MALKTSLKMGAKQTLRQCFRLIKRVWRVKVLQNGCPKSGNYWLYNILTTVLDKADVPRKSVIKNNPVHKIAKDWVLSYPEQAGLDVIDIESGKNYMRIGSYFKYPISDIDEYIDANRLVWTHSRFIPECKNVYNKFDKVVYIIRDPRDLAISMAHFSFTPYRLNYLHNPFEDVEDYLNTHFVRHITGWCQHVGSHLMSDSIDNIHVVFYENLKQNFEEELGKILAYLEISLSETDKKSVQEMTSVTHMSKKSKGHVRKGKAGGWQDVLTKKQAKQCSLVAGPILDALGYTRSHGGVSAPKLPETIPKRAIKNSMQRSILTRGYIMFKSNRKNIIRPNAAVLDTQ